MSRCTPAAACRSTTRFTVGREMTRSWAACSSARMGTISSLPVTAACSPAGPGRPLQVPIRRAICIEPSAGYRQRLRECRPGVGDILDLSRDDADTSTEGDQAFTFIGTGTFTGSAGQLRVYDGTEGAVVEGDVDGNE